MFLSSIDPSMMATQGTDIARAIDMASHSFTQEEGIGKAIIVITDGEDHEGGALEAAEAAKKAGMRVYVLGVGSVKGSPIPVPGTGDYMRDNTGEVVMSALNEQMCREVAQAGGGAYIHVENNSSAQRQLDEELDKLEKRETESTIYSDYDEQFQAVGILALLLLLIEICIFDRKNPLLKNLSLFGNKKQATALLVLMFALSASAQDARQYIRNGNKLYRAGDYVKAEVAYSKAVAKDSLNPQAAYNLGNALMMQQKDSSAIVQYQKAARLEKNPLRLSQSFHNIGVICQKKQLFAEAIEAYKQSLRLNPNDDETRYNLVLCQRQQKQQQQNQKQQGQDKDDKQDQQKQEKQQQQQDKKQQKSQEQKPQMSKENAEQLLQDAMRQEQQTQKRLKEAQQQPQRRQLQKNW
jgi:Ca-activated chloride channel family protein